jgi:hypothetical protein
MKVSIFFLLFIRPHVSHGRGGRHHPGCSYALRKYVRPDAAVLGVHPVNGKGIYPPLERGFPHMGENENPYWVRPAVDRQHLSAVASLSGAVTRSKLYCDPGDQQTLQTAEGNPAQGVPSPLSVG